MNQLRVLASAALLASTFAFAQPAPAPAEAASKPMMDCHMMAKHDHGAEKGTPGSKPMCGKSADAAASAPKKKVLAHDHGKFHKQQ